MNDKPNYYAIMPAHIRYSELSQSAKLMFAEITALSNQTGRCYAGNEYFAQLYSVSVGTVTRWIRELQAGGYIECEVMKGNKRSIRMVGVQGDPLSKMIGAPIKNDRRSTNSMNTKKEYDVHAGFEMFWALYPKEGRKNKSDAKIQYDKLIQSHEKHELVMQGLQKQIQYAKHMDDKGEWRPHFKHANRWLKGKCWEDEVPEVKGKATYRSLDQL